MKKIIMTVGATLLLCTSALLCSCAGNTATDTSSTTGIGKPEVTETQKETDKDILDEAESRLEDMSEEATHGIDDGGMGGSSSRGGDRTLFPRGK